MAKVIMVQGTASGVGKTIIVTALCRILARRGYNVAPFKAQNITPNAVAIDGGEIAASQLLQAQAAKVTPDIRMNPVVVRPVEGSPTEIIVNGEVITTTAETEFSAIKKSLGDEAKKAYTSLSSKYDVIVIEGAGSPVELNLIKDDYVNMGMALYANAPVLLVSDIARGGVFAALYGTVSLYSEQARALVSGLIINKFLGDIDSFDEGAEIIAEITGKPIAGVVPHIPFVMPEEDAIYDPRNDVTLSDEELERQFEFIADEFEKHLDIELIISIIEGSGK